MKCRSVIFLCVVLQTLSSIGGVFAYESTSHSSLDDSISVSAFVPLRLAPAFPDNNPQADPNSGVVLDVHAGMSTVVFSGFSHPLSTITLLKNGIRFAQVSALPSGLFSLSVSHLSTGSYNFAVRATDSFGLYSSLTPVSVFVTNNETTLISNIIVSPTISSSYSTVKFGDSVHFYGSSLPMSSVVLSFGGLSQVMHGTANGDGVWDIEVDSRMFTFGQHSATVVQYVHNDVSLEANPVVFTVSSKSVLRASSTLPNSSVDPKCDLNNDGYVNLKDFSIMSYWYARNPFPRKVDLNSDSLLTLFDFSILAYCWTG